MPSFLLLDGGEEAGEFGSEFEEDGFFEEFVAVDFACVVEVFGEHAGDFVDVLLGDEDGGDLEVEAKGAVVEIAGADGGGLVVDEEGLLVHEAVAVAKEANAVGEGLAVVGKGGEPDEEVVGLFGKKDADVDSA